MDPNSQTPSQPDNDANLLPVPDWVEAPWTDEQAQAEIAAANDPNNPANRNEPSFWQSIPKSVWVVAALIAMFGIGFAGGAALMRQRYHAHDTVASVNGVVIYAPDFHNRVESVAGTQVLGQMLNEEMIRQFAKTVGALPSEAQVEARFKEISGLPTYGPYLVASHKSEDDVKKDIRFELTQANILGNGQTATDAEIRAYYDANADRQNPKARFFTPDTTTISVIITPVEEDARKAVSELHQGADFAAVAKTYSKDPSSRQGGVLPAVQRGRSNASRVPGLEQATFGLSAGQQLGPRKFAGAWWIIRCLDKKPEHLLPFEQVKDECRIAVLTSKGANANGKQMLDRLTEFKKKADLRIFWSKYTGVVQK